MEKVLCLRIFYRWKIITSKNYFPCLCLELKKVVLPQFS